MYLEDGQDCPKCVGKNLNIVWFIFYTLFHTYWLHGAESFLRN